MRRLILPFLIIAALLASCTQTEPDGAYITDDERAQEEVNESVEYKKISGDDAAGMMSDDAIILDVRTAEEYAEGHIQDAVLLPYDEISDQAAELLPDKDATILVYCRTGRRSEIAAKELISMGYTAVYDFGGITTDWNGDIVK